MEENINNSKSEIEFIKTSETNLFEKIFENLNKAIDNNFIIDKFIKKNKPFNYYSNKYGNYEFNNLIFKYKVNIITSYFEKTNSRVNKIQFKVSNDEFYKKQLNSRQYTHRFENMYDISQNMLNILKNNFERCFKEFDVEDMTFSGYFNIENFNIEIFGEKIKNNIILLRDLINPDLFDKLIKHSIKFNEIYEFSILFVSDKPIINLLEYQYIKTINNINLKETNLSCNW